MWADRAGVAGVFLIAASLCLAGCTEGSSKEQVAEKAIEEATGGEADVDVREQEVTVESENGTVTVGEALPDDFPGDVPVPDGKIQSASSLQGKGWAVTLRAKGDAASVAAAIKQQLLGAGFAIEREDEIAGGRMLLATGAKHQATASISSASGSTGVVYTVAPTSG